MATDGEAPGIDLKEPRMEDMKTLLVAGLMKEYSAATAAEIPLLWQQLSSHFGKIPGRLGGKAYGVLYNMNGPTGFAYLAGVEVASASEIPEELNVVRIPDLKCAVFTHEGSVATLADTMSAIWNQWLPASGLKRAKPDDEMPDMLEQYDESFDPASGTGGITVWVPIKNRSRMVTFESRPETTGE